MMTKCCRFPTVAVARMFRKHLAQVVMSGPSVIKAKDSRSRTPVIKHSHNLVSFSRLLSYCQRLIIFQPRTTSLNYHPSLRLQVVSHRMTRRGGGWLGDGWGGWRGGSDGIGGIERIVCYSLTFLLIGLLLHVHGYFSLNFVIFISLL